MTAVTSERLKVVDLFSGVGGLSLGFEQAGFDVAAAVELDPIHAATHSQNFPSTRMLAGAIEDIHAAEILTASNRQPGEISVLIGGPPCQGFSAMGKRRHDDPRNQLIMEFARLVNEVRPYYFVMENVKGILYSSDDPGAEERACRTTRAETHQRSAMSRPQALHQYRTVVAHVCWVRICLPQSPGSHGRELVPEKWTTSRSCPSSCTP